MPADDEVTLGIHEPPDDDRGLTDDDLGLTDEELSELEQDRSNRPHLKAPGQLRRRTTRKELAAHAPAEDPVRSRLEDAIAAAVDEPGSWPLGTALPAATELPPAARSLEPEWPTEPAGEQPWSATLRPEYFDGATVVMKRPVFAPLDLDDEPALHPVPGPGQADPTGPAQSPEFDDVADWAREEAEQAQAALAAAGSAPEQVDQGARTTAPETGLEAPGDPAWFVPPPDENDRDNDTQELPEGLARAMAGAQTPGPESDRAPDEADRQGIQPLATLASRIPAALDEPLPEGDAGSTDEDVESDRQSPRDRMAILLAALSRSSPRYDSPRPAPSWTLPDPRSPAEAEPPRAPVESDAASSIPQEPWPPQPTAPPPAAGEDSAEDASPAHDESGAFGADPDTPGIIPIPEIAANASELAFSDAPPAETRPLDRREVAHRLTPSLLLSPFPPAADYVERPATERSRAPRFAGREGYRASPARRPTPADPPADLADEQAPASTMEPVLAPEVRPEADAMGPFAEPEAEAIGQPVETPQPIAADPTVQPEAQADRPLGTPEAESGDAEFETSPRWPSPLPADLAEPPLTGESTSELLLSDLQDPGTDQEPASDPAELHSIEELPDEDLELAEEDEPAEEGQPPSASEVHSVEELPDEDLELASEEEPEDLAPRVDEGPASLAPSPGTPRLVSLRPTTPALESLTTPAEGTWVPDPAPEPLSSPAQVSDLLAKVPEAVAAAAEPEADGSLHGAPAEDLELGEELDDEEPEELRRVTLPLPEGTGAEAEAEVEVDIDLDMEMEEERPKLPKAGKKDLPPIIPISSHMPSRPVEPEPSEAPLPPPIPAPPVAPEPAASDADLMTSAPQPEWTGPRPAPPAPSSPPRPAEAPPTAVEDPRPRKHKPPAVAARLSAQKPPPTSPTAREAPAPKAVPETPAPEPTATPANQAGRIRKRPWYLELFGPDWLATHPPLPREQVEAEVRFILQCLGPTRESRLLQLGCGDGTHLLEMSRLGFQVTCYDMSLPLLLRAADMGQRKGIAPSFLQGDFRDIPAEEDYDAVLCIKTHFGYFDDDNNQKVIVAVGRALKPGGRFLLEIINRDYLIRDMPARVWRDGDQCVVLEEVDFDYFTSRLQSKRTVVFEDGRHVEQEISLRVYSLHEIGRLLHRSGFRVVEATGHIAHRGHFFGSHSASLLLTAEKRP